MKSRLLALRPLFMVAALLAALLAPASASGTSVKQVALTFDDGDSERHIRQAHMLQHIHRARAKGYVPNLARFGFRNTPRAL